MNCNELDVGDLARNQQGQTGVVLHRTPLADAFHFEGCFVTGEYTLVGDKLVVDEIQLGEAWETVCPEPIAALPTYIFRALIGQGYFKSEGPKLDISYEMAAQASVGRRYEMLKDRPRGSLRTWEAQDYMRGFYKGLNTRRALEVHAYISADQGATWSGPYRPKGLVNVFRLGDWIAIRYRNNDHVFTRTFVFTREHCDPIDHTQPDT